VRFVKGLTVGLAAVCLAGLVGCSSAGPGPSIAGWLAASPKRATSFAPRAVLASPQLQASARAAAAQFYGLYSAGHFAASWNLLSSATKRQISEQDWLGVHDACASARAGKSRVIKAVIVFGDAAIVTEAITGFTSEPYTTEDVFDYAAGRWSYSPADPSIYQHESIVADIAAAKAAGFCTSWRVF
jgi:hypothetical protein